ncbi:MAG: hypothetical protein ABI690_27380 [Chloroflexota bacterium]
MALVDITFKYLGRIATPSLMVGNQCATPTTLTSDYDWHFQLTRVPSNLYPRQLRAPGSAGGGVWFNPSATALRTDNHCDPSTPGRWPMYAVRSGSGTEFTWDIYVAPYQTPSQNQDPQPGVEWLMDLAQGTTISFTARTLIPGIKYLGKVATPYQENSIVLSVGNNCASPSTQNVTHDFRFGVYGVPQLRTPIIIRNTYGGLWIFNQDANGNPVCNPNNNWPMKPVASTNEEAGSGTGPKTYSWTLYVAVFGNDPKTGDQYRVQMDDSSEISDILYVP